jgi:hypothetical protein
MISKETSGEGLSQLKLKLKLKLLDGGTVKLGTYLLHSRTLRCILNLLAPKLCSTTIEFR